MRVAVVQLNSQEDVAQNLDRVRALVRRAAREEGAELVALPENFAFMGEEKNKREIAESTDVESGKAGPITKAIVETAKENGVAIVAGGMPEASGDAERPFNTSLFVSPSGVVMARYRKIHLFDVDLPDGTKLLESGATKAGDDPVVVDVKDGLKLGMTICYDLRFPELYRKLVDRGVRIVTVPAAFTLTTGKDHWHVLLRARAIENQIFVLAPAQHGKHPRNRMTYGKSIIVDPWGDVLAQSAEGEGIATATLSFESQDRVRKSLPCLQHRRL
jgi:deaminated glutathione amidase